MLRKNLLFTLMFFISIIAWSQTCPKGYTWDNEKATCLQNDRNKGLAVVNYKCPNGYSWVSFKNDCLTNIRVKEIYDSLRILYLDSPELRETPIVKTEVKKPKIKKDKPKIEPEPEPEPKLEPVVETVMVVQTTTEEQTKQIQKWIEKGMDSKKEIINLKSQMDSLKRELEVLKSWTETRGVGNTKGSELAALSSMQEQLTLQKMEIEDLKRDIALLKSRPANFGSNTNYTFDVGQQNGTISKKDIYGQENLTFEIHCPTGYKWVNEESICLRSEKFLERSQVLAQDPNGKVQYGIKDVKCPSNFRWNSASNQCIPTLHAVQK